MQIAFTRFKKVSNTTADGTEMANSTLDKFPLNPATNAKSIDETRLETDISYRFEFVCDVIGLTKEDHDVLRKHQQTLEPHLSEIVEAVYRKMFDYESMKRHFLPRHTGFDGNVPASINELKFDHAQTEFRKMEVEGVLHQTLYSRMGRHLRAAIGRCRAHAHASAGQRESSSSHGPDKCSYGSDE